MAILVVAELASGKLKNSTLSAITFARQAAAIKGGGFDILVLGAKGSSDVANALAKYGAGKVLLCEDPSFEHYVAEAYSPTVSSVGQNYELMVATATSFGKDLMPRVAARLDAGFAGDVASVVNEGGKLAYRRPTYAGNAYAFVALESRHQVATCRQSEFAPAEAAPSASPIERIGRAASGQALSRVEFVSLEQSKSSRPDLGDARIVVSGGRAFKERFFEVLEPLADVLNAAIGASRAACDAGYAPGDLQVGQTGKVVAPDLYIAIGISGAIQHIAGMKSSKTIVAINKDPEAPIFQIADYGLVADLFEVVPRLVEALKQKLAAG